MELLLTIGAVLKITPARAQKYFTAARKLMSIKVNVDILSTMLGCLGFFITLFFFFFGLEDGIVCGFRGTYITIALQEKEHTMKIIASAQTRSKPWR